MIVIDDGISTISPEASTNLQNVLKSMSFCNAESSSISSVNNAATILLSPDNDKSSSKSLTISERDLLTTRNKPCDIKIPINKIAERENNTASFIRSVQNEEGMNENNQGICIDLGMTEVENDGHSYFRSPSSSRLLRANRQRFYGFSEEFVTEFESEYLGTGEGKGARSTKFAKSSIQNEGATRNKRKREIEFSSDSEGQSVEECIEETPINKSSRKRFCNKEVLKNNLNSSDDPNVTRSATKARKANQSFKRLASRRELKKMTPHESRKISSSLSNRFRYCSSERKLPWELKRTCFTFKVTQIPTQSNLGEFHDQQQLEPPGNSPSSVSQLPKRSLSRRISLMMSSNSPNHSFTSPNSTSVESSLTSQIASSSAPLELYESIVQLGTPHQSTASLTSNDSNNNFEEGGGLAKKLLNSLPYKTSASLYKMNEFLGSFTKTSGLLNDAFKASLEDPQFLRLIDMSIHEAYDPHRGKIRLNPIWLLEDKNDAHINYKVSSLHQRNTGSGISKAFRRGKQFESYWNAPIGLMLSVAKKLKFYKSEELTGDDDHDDELLRHIHQLIQKLKNDDSLKVNMAQKNNKSNRNGLMFDNGLLDRVIKKVESKSNLHEKCGDSSHSEDSTFFESKADISKLDMKREANKTDNKSMIEGRVKDEWRIDTTELLDSKGSQFLVKQSEVQHNCDEDSIESRAKSCSTDFHSDHSNEKGCYWATKLKVEDICVVLQSDEIAKLLSAMERSDPYASIYAKKFGKKQSEPKEKFRILAHALTLRRNGCRAEFDVQHKQRLENDEENKNDENEEASNNTFNNDDGPLLLTLCIDPNKLRLLRSRGQFNTRVVSQQKNLLSDALHCNFGTGYLSSLDSPKSLKSGTTRESNNNHHDSSLSSLLHSEESASTSSSEIRHISSKHVDARNETWFSTDRYNDEIDSNDDLEILNTTLRQASSSVPKVKRALSATSKIIARKKVDSSLSKSTGSTKASTTMTHRMSSAYNRRAGRPKVNRSGCKCLLCSTYQTPQWRFMILYDDDQWMDLVCNACYMKYNGSRPHYSKSGKVPPPLPELLNVEKPKRPTLEEYKTRGPCAYPHLMRRNDSKQFAILGKPTLSADSTLPPNARRGGIMNHPYDKDLKGLESGYQSDSSHYNIRPANNCQWQQKSASVRHPASHMAKTDNKNGITKGNECLSIDSRSPHRISVTRNIFGHREDQNRNRKITSSSSSSPSPILTSTPLKQQMYNNMNIQQSNDSNMVIDSEWKSRCPKNQSSLVSDQSPCRCYHPNFYANGYSYSSAITAHPMSSQPPTTVMSYPSHFLNSPYPSLSAPVAQVAAETIVGMQQSSPPFSSSYIDSVASNCALATPFLPVQAVSNTTTPAVQLSINSFSSNGVPYTHAYNNTNNIYSLIDNSNNNNNNNCADRGSQRRTIVMGYEERPQSYHDDHSSLSLSSFTLSLPISAVQMGSPVLSDQ